MFSRADVVHNAHHNSTVADARTLKKTPAPRDTAQAAVQQVTVGRERGSKTSKTVVQELSEMRAPIAQLRTGRPFNRGTGSGRGSTQKTQDTPTVSGGRGGRGAGRGGRGGGRGQGSERSRSRGGFRRNCGKKHEGQQCWYPPLCWKCKQPGHRREECKNPPANQVPSGVDMKPKPKPAPQGGKTPSAPSSN